MTSKGKAEMTLVEMDEAHYRDYRESLAREYAADKVRAGAWSPAEAEGRRREIIISIQYGTRPCPLRSGSCSSPRSTPVSVDRSGSRTSSTSNSDAVDKRAVRWNWSRSGA